MRLSAHRRRPPSDREQGSGAQRCSGGRSALVTRLHSRTEHISEMSIRTTIQSYRAVKVSTRSHSDESRRPFGPRERLVPRWPEDPGESSSRRPDAPRGVRTPGLIRPLTIESAESGCAGARWEVGTFRPEGGGPFGLARDLCWTLRDPSVDERRGVIWLSPVRPGRDPPLDGSSRARPSLGVPGHQVGDSRLSGGRPPRAVCRREVLYVCSQGARASRRCWLVVNTCR